MLAALPKILLAVLLGLMGLRLQAAEPATSYDDNERISTYEAYWDDPRPLLKDAEQILRTLDPNKDPKRWLQVFAAYGMANDAGHLIDDIEGKLILAKKIAESMQLHELMIDVLIIEGAYIETLNAESPATTIAKFGLDPSVAYEKALAIADKYKLVRDRQLILSNYKSRLFVTGQGGKALKYFESAWSLLRSPNMHEIDRLNLIKNLVFVLKVANNQPEKVRSLTQELAENCHRVHYRSLCSFAFYDFGISLYSTKISSKPNYKKAHEYLVKAEELALKIDDWSMLAIISLALAEIAQDQKLTAEVLHYAKKSEEYSRINTNYNTLATAMLWQANAFREIKAYDKAIEILQKLKAELPKSLTKDQINMTKLFADVYEEMGQWEKALKSRNSQVYQEKTFQKQMETQNFTQQSARLGIQLEQEKNKALTTQNELQERKLQHADYERKTIAVATLLVIMIAVSLLGCLLWVNRKNREIHKLHDFIETQVLQRFLPPKIVGEILSGKSHFEQSAQSRMVTVLFGDLVNFTHTAERLEPQQLSELLNSFFAEMSEVVFEQGGVIDKFIGDAIMVVFGAPLEMSPKEQAESAANCARLLLECLERLNREWQKKFDINFSMRIGIHQGFGVVGAFGSKRRSDYTVIGHTVNLTSRIEGKAKPDQILMSEIVARQLPENRVAFAGSFFLKGIEQPMPLFSLVIPSKILAKPDQNPNPRELSA